VAGSTTLTHVAAIPILVSDSDLVILDHQVHGSVQLAVQLAKAKGTRVEMIRHNRLDALESLISENPNRYHKIWYMADGLYSMYGDFAPIKELVFLLEKYGNFHIYIDDAHGMSWMGKNGAGYVVSQQPLHPKMILSTSLAKGFGTGGGVLVTTDPEISRKILTCGSSFTFSGPVQPPMLGASIASARIHLSDEIYELQASLAEKIKYTQSVISELQLPSVSSTNSPIFYLGLGLPRVGYNMVKRLLNDGYYANIGIFPAVPVKCTGLRLPITNAHSKEDIKGILEAFDHHLPKVLEEEKITIEKIGRNFNLSMEATIAKYNAKSFKEPDFKIQHENSIVNIAPEVWDPLLGDRGIFDWEGCLFIENTFKDNPEPENNWNFHYIIIRDRKGAPILATFFTDLLCKDDMIAPANVSQQIEEIRKLDRYYLTSRCIMMGSLITEGNHLYLDKASPLWKNALTKLIAIMDNERAKVNGNMIQIRDIDSEDDELNEFFIKDGFIRVDMPETHEMDLDWVSLDDHLKTLSSKSRWHFRRNILDYADDYTVRFLDGTGQDYDYLAYHRLYMMVKNRSLNINTFQLPDKFFQQAARHKNWEFIELSVKNGNETKIGSFGVCYKSGKNYIPMVIGIDYDLNTIFNCYRQNMFRVMLRAKELKSKKLLLGMDASLEKTRLGARAIRKSVYLQIQDNFKLDIMSLIKNESETYSERHKGV
jgi:7-keto-8-aminopelargonate synthetase-like enzyme